MRAPSASTSAFLRTLFLSLVNIRWPNAPSLVCRDAVFLTVSKTSEGFWSNEPCIIFKLKKPSRFRKEEGRDPAVLSTAVVPAPRACLLPNRCSINSHWILKLGKGHVARMRKTHGRANKWEKDYFYGRTSVRDQVNNVRFLSINLVMETGSLHPHILFVALSWFLFSHRALPLL